METKKELEEKKQHAAKTRDAKIAAYYKGHGPNKLSRDPSDVSKVKRDYDRTASKLDKRIARIEQTAKVAGAVADIEAKYFELSGGGHSRMQVPTADTLDDTAAAHAGYFQLEDRLGATRILGEVWGTLAGARLTEIGSSFLGKQFAKWAGRGAAKNVTKEIKVRPTPGRDGATSTHTIERVDGQVNSVTHQVTKDGKVLHQHQTHIGKHGTERRFPDEWVENPTLPKE